MKPLLFSLLDTPAFGGAEQYLLGHLYYLADHEYEVVLATNCQAVKDRVSLENQKRQAQGLATIICKHAPYRLDAIGNWKGLVKYFLSLPAALFWIYVTLRQLESQYEQIIALLPGFSDRLSFSPIIKVLGMPLIWIEIGPYEPIFPRNWGFPKLLLSLTKSLPDHFITTSKFTLTSMVKTGGIPEHEITLVYPGTPTFTQRQIQILAKTGRNLRLEFQLKNKTLITFTGRLASENEVELVIQAFSRLLSQHSEYVKNLHLLIIGDGPERQRYQAIADQEKVAPHITFTGFISETEKFSWLAVSDIFVFTRAWELDGFGMTTIEAMSVGTPVITSNFGPQIEIVKDGENGLLFEPHNYHSLAERLEDLISKPALRKKLGKNGLNHVRQTFSISRQNQVMHDIIRKYS